MTEPSLNTSDADRLQALLEVTAGVRAVEITNLLKRTKDTRALQQAIFDYGIGRMRKIAEESKGSGVIALVKTMLDLCQDPAKRQIIITRAAAGFLDMRSIGGVFMLYDSVQNELSLKEAMLSVQAAHPGKILRFSVSVSSNQHRHIAGLVFSHDDVRMTTAERNAQGDYSILRNHIPIREMLTYKTFDTDGRKGLNNKTVGFLIHSVRAMTEHPVEAFAFPAKKALGDIQTLLHLRFHHVLTPSSAQPGGESPVLQQG